MTCFSLHAGGDKNAADTYSTDEENNEDEDDVVNDDGSEASDGSQASMNDSEVSSGEGAAGKVSAAAAARGAAELERMEAQLDVVHVLRFRAVAEQLMQELQKGGRAMHGTATCIRHVVSPMYARNDSPTSR